WLGPRPAHRRQPAGVSRHARHDPRRVGNLSRARRRRARRSRRQRARRVHHRARRGVAMARYAIGDIQGCKASLDRLLAAIDYDPSRDQLWLVGDLVNRGPRSLDVLRWAIAQGDAVTAVLGNHDLHLLARAAGVAGEKKRDTLDDVLGAADRDALIDWLRHRPLVHVEGPHAMVHGGLHPRWSIDLATTLAREIEVH